MLFRSRFVSCVKEFVDELLAKYVEEYTPIIFNDDERQAIAIQLSYNPHMLNNPRRYDPIAIKAVLV